MKGTRPRRTVVSFFFSTSNHNGSELTGLADGVVSFFFSTSNHNASGGLAFLHCCIILLFYIKPQRVWWSWYSCSSCIILLFYIKPQLNTVLTTSKGVVSFFFSTSNHNKIAERCYFFSVVSFFFSTSNHNCSFYNV